MSGYAFGDDTLDERSFTAFILLSASLLLFVLFKCFNIKDKESIDQRINYEEVNEIDEKNN